MLGNIFDWITETVSDAFEFLTGMFENIGDISPSGLAFGSLAVLFLFFTRNYMLNSFLVHMTTGAAIFWGGLTYIMTGVVGYLIGKKILEDE